jgi:ABC-2 type transport system permease protein
MTVGPDLISQDLRFNAMPLYFSRPLRRVDYFMGKLGVIATYLAAVAIGPALVAYLLGVAFSLDWTVLRDTWRILVGAVAYGSVVVLSAGTLMLAISSLSRNSRLVGAAWIGLWVITNVASSVLQQSVRRDWCPLVSYTSNLDRIREEVLDTAQAREKFLDLVEASRRASQEAARPRLPIGGKLRRFGLAPRRPAPPPPPSAAPPALLAEPENAALPWTWSAGVLGALFVLSALTLSTRVKSLDRLR